MHLYSLVAWHEQPDNEPEEGEGKALSSSKKSLAVNRLRNKERAAPSLWSAHGQSLRDTTLLGTAADMRPGGESAR